jgi:hypothetical protein
MPSMPRADWIETAKTPKFLRKAQNSGCGWNGPIAWDVYEHESAKARNDRLRLIQTIRRRGLDRVAVALDTRRLVSSEFPRCNKGACVPAPWTGRCS